MFVGTRKWEFKRTNWRAKAYFKRQTWVLHEQGSTLWHGSVRPWHSCANSLPLLQLQVNFSMLIPVTQTCQSQLQFRLLWMKVTVWQKHTSPNRLLSPSPGFLVVMGPPEKTNCRYVCDFRLWGQFKLGFYTGVKGNSYCHHRRYKQPTGRVG